MRGRNAQEKAEFDRNGYIRRGELRSSEGRAGADRRRSAIQGASLFFPLCVSF